MRENIVDQEARLGCSWLVVLVAGLFFFYEFIQMNMFDTIGQTLVHVLSLDAAQLGLLSSIYFMANVVFLFLAGVVLDRYSTKKVILIALSICVLGTFIFFIRA